MRCAGEMWLLIFAGDTQKVSTKCRKNTQRRDAEPQRSNEGKSRSLVFSAVLRLCVGCWAALEVSTLRAGNAKPETGNSGHHLAMASMPVLLMTGAAAGEEMNLMYALAACGSLELVTKPAENTVRF